MGLSGQQQDGAAPMHEHGSVRPMLAVLLSDLQGVTEEMLQKETPQISQEERIKAINDLISNKRLQLFHVTGSKKGKKSFAFKEITQEEAIK
jgi:hypothetical protein